MVKGCGVVDHMRHINVLQLRHKNFTKLQSLSNNHNMKSTIKSSGLSKSLSNRGFTLIEMLVVIAIIAILTGIIVTNMSGAKAKARDAKRISDLGNIQMALELYFDRCNLYPQSDGVTVGQGGDSSSCGRQKPGGTQYYSMSDFIETIPTPPNSTSAEVYAYKATPDGRSYMLHTSLEVQNDSITKDSVPDSKRQYNIDSANDFSCYSTNAPTNYCLSSPNIETQVPGGGNHAAP